MGKIGKNEVTSQNFLRTISEVLISLKCKFCDFETKSEEELKFHFIQTHTTTDKNEPNSPNSLQNILDNKSNVSVSESDSTCEKNAEIENESTEIFLCSECSIIFKTQQSCYDHLTEFHDLNIDLLNPESEQVSKKASDEEDSSNSNAVQEPKYRKSKQNNALRCPECFLKFSTEEVLNFHKESHVSTISNNYLSSSSKRGFTCIICLGNSQNPADYSIYFSNWAKCCWHLYKSHDIDCELPSCDFPNCKFKSHLVSKVKEHMKIHGANSFKCLTCHKSFKQLKQLRVHEKYHRAKSTKLAPPQDSRWYTTKECPECKRIFSDSKCLKKHIGAVHNKLRPHVCNICPHTSARKAELLLHMRQHTGEKPYKCKFCNFATGDHNSLRKHSQTHTGKKSYICKLCDFQSIQSSGFKKHMLAKHPSEINSTIFTCSQCNLTTVSQEIYNNHLKDHEEGRVGKNINLSIIEPPQKHEERFTKTTGFWETDDSIDLVLVDTGGITIPATNE